MADGTANLIPAKPGEVRNPKGKPKGTRNRSTILRELSKIVLNSKSLDDKEGAFTVEEIANMMLWRKAMEGDLNAMKEIQDTLYGKVKDVVDTVVSTKAENDLTEAVLSKISEEELEAILAREPQNNE